MPPHRDLRDPVHGFIRIEGRECDVVDTPVFQRLRRIKQLALAHLVYPGAVHNRLEHTLGVMHVAGRLCEKLDIDPEKRRLIRLAALLHDIGHGPFSHPSEEVLSALAADELSDSSATDKIHELITREIIRTDQDLGKLISDRDREDIIKLLDQGLGQPIHKDLVSGPLDADKQDYLLRDSYHCGVRYGVYDIDRLHDVLCRVTDQPGDTLAIDEDGINTLEQFVLARYYLTTQVISHKGRRITDAMLVRGLTLGVRSDEIEFLNKLYGFEPTLEFMNEYVQWNDERLMSRLLEPEFKASWAGQFMRRLAERRLFKIVFRKSVTEFTDLILDASVFDSISATLEGGVAEILGVQPEEVIFKVHRSPPTRKAEGAVLISRGTGQPTQFETESLVFRSIDRTLREEHLECYAPIDGVDDHQRKERTGKVEDFVIRRIPELLDPSDL